MKNRGIWLGYDGVQSPPGGWEVDTDHPLASGLILNAGMAQGAGPSANDLNGSVASVLTPQNLGWKTPPGTGGFGVARNSAVQSGAQYETLQLLRSYDCSKSFSYEVWCVMRSYKASSPFISGLMVGGTDVLRFGDAGIAMNKAQFGIAGAGKIASTTTYGTNVPIQLVGVYNGAGNDYLYGNGQQEATGAVSPTTASRTSVYLFRDDDGSLTRSPDGMIISARVWDRALSASEVASLYNSPYEFMRPPTRRRPDYASVAAFVMPGRQFVARQTSIFLQSQ